MRFFLPYAIDMSASETDEKQVKGVVESVSMTVIETFLTELSKLPDVEGVSERLRAVMIEDSSSTEASLREALFGEDES